MSERKQPFETREQPQDRSPVPIEGDDIDAAWAKVRAEEREELAVRRERWRKELRGIAALGAAKMSS